MNKLLSANFFRLWKTKAFWIELMVLFLMSAGLMLNGCRQAGVMREAGYEVYLDDYYFLLSAALGLFYAIFVSLFLGTEYSDGTIRNKLIVGHTRSGIYLANFMVCFVAGLCFLAAWLAGGLIGIPFLGTWNIGAVGMAAYILITICSMAAFIGIYTFWSMLSTNRATTAVVAILIWLALLLGESMFFNALCEPEFSEGIILTAQGIKQSAPIPNPNYVTGFRRTLYTWMVEILPVQMDNAAMLHPVTEVVSSLVIAVVTTIGGIFGFSRKDLK